MSEDDEDAGLIERAEATLRRAEAAGYPVLPSELGDLQAERADRARLDHAITRHGFHVVTCEDCGGLGCDRCKGDGFLCSYRSKPCDDPDCSLRKAPAKPPAWLDDSIQLSPPREPTGD